MTQKNPYHNFTKENLKELITEHNNQISQKKLMPTLDLNNPKIKNAIERGKKIAQKNAKEERKITKHTQ